MKRLTQITALTGALVLPLALQHSAEAAIFDFTNGFIGIDTAPLFSFAEDGITLTATGLLDDGTSADVSQTLFGLGVVEPDDLLLDPLTALAKTVQVDENELLALSFDQEVNLVSATFTQFGTGNQFTLLIAEDGSVVTTTDTIPVDFAFPIPLLPINVGEYTFSPTPTGSLFGFTVPSAADGFILSALNVEAAEVIPEPLTLLGVGTAISFGAFFKRKLTKSQKF